MRTQDTSICPLGEKGALVGRAWNFLWVRPGNNVRNPMWEAMATRWDPLGKGNAWNIVGRQRFEVRSSRKELKKKPQCEG